MMLRDVAACDLQSLAQLEQETFANDAWTVGMLREELNAPARTYLVFDDGEGSIVAYGGFWFDGDDAELMTIGVSPKFRRQGLAKQLLTSLLERSNSQGARRMILEVRVDNDPALQLYQSFHFKRLGIRKRYYQPEGIDAYTMGLNLDGCNAQ
jgi:[ribosomal protein S18]-alanine N-acetyltransferase